MRFRHSAALLVTLVAAARLAGQAASASVSPSPSQVVQPATSAIKQALATTMPDRWKLTKATRDVTSGNLDSISRDLHDTLPPLLSGAETAPTSPASLLPVTRNLAALYEVLLRVTVVAEGSAPKEQVTALEQALNSLQTARHLLEDRLQAASTDQDHRLAELQTNLVAARSAAASPVPPAATSPPCQPAGKKKRAAKPGSA